MNPDHLKVGELSYEIACREAKPYDNQVLRRAQLRGLVSKEKRGLTIVHASPFEFEIDIKGIKESIDDINTVLGENKPLLAVPACLRLNSRLLHLYHRIDLLKTANDMQKSIKSDLCDAVTLLEGYLDEQNDTRETQLASVSTLNQSLNQSMNATVNMTATPINTVNTNVKRVDVYKWNIKFNGNRNKESVMSFLEKIDDLRVARNVSVAELFNSAVDLFSEAGLLWYRSVRDEVTNWDELVIKLKRDFLSIDYDYELLAEIINRTQGPSEDITLYIISVEALYRRLESPRSEREIVDQLMRNLNPYFCERLALVEINGLTQLKDTCRRIQETKIRMSKYQPPPSKKTGLLEPDLACLPISLKDNDENPVAEFKMDYKNSSVRTVRCFKCNKEGHIKRDCRSQSQVVCYGCGLPDTYKPQCPKCSPKNVQSGAVMSQTFQKSQGAVPKQTMNPLLHSKAPNSDLQSKNRQKPPR